MLNNVFSYDAMIIGKLTRETIINRNNEIFIDHPGGNLLYTAYGFSLWGKTAGLISRIGCDFPDEWLEKIPANSFNVSGITKTMNHSDSRDFFLVDEENKIVENNPLKYFSERNLPLPKTLFGFESNTSFLDEHKKASNITIQPENIPNDFLESRYLALCPVDFYTHYLIPTFYRSRTEGEVFLHLSKSYAHPSFFFDIQPLVFGSTLVLISEEDAKKLFYGKSDDLWAIADSLASYGVEIVAVSRTNGGYDILDNTGKKKFHIPSYTVTCIDPVGVQDAFFGGFLAGYLNHFDPVYASIIGCVTASVKKEGSTPNFLLGVLPELLNARVEFLKEKVELM